MLKSLNKENHNSDNFSEYCLRFYCQPARPLPDEESQTALPNTRSNFSFSISLFPWIDSPKDNTIYLFNGSAFWFRMQSNGPTTATVVFDVSLAVRSMWNNTLYFGINGYIALLPNPVSSTANTSLPCLTTIRVLSIRSSLRVSWTKPSGKAFKAEKVSLFARFVRCHDGTHQLARFLCIH